jgi:hypothetical protein
MKQLVPSLTPDAMYEALKSTAIDMDDPSTAGFNTGFDFGTGFGLIQADRAANAIAPDSEAIPPPNQPPGPGTDPVPPVPGPTSPPVPAPPPLRPVVPVLPRTNLCRGLAATILGTEGRDIIIGTPGPDVIQGLGGNDVVRGNGGSDVICGGSGNDRLFGGPGRDRLFGEAGRDRLNGGPGGDRCNGGSGTDTGASCERKTRIRCD